jgi:glycosyltransferase involved in cell wall biosynthesis
LKVSVLLPTRDRLDYLRHAVQSVLSQDAGDWEVIVSDNFSSEDVAGYLASVQDDRVRYVRTPRLVPVTENWNNALRHSEGDYVLMLGDDDALLPGYMAAIGRLVAQFDEPDLIYHKAILYTYPGVSPQAPFAQPYGCAAFFDGRNEPFHLERAQARKLVKDATNFKFNYDFNMQFATVRRETIEALGGFKSPFPDYYAMNLLFHEAHSIVVDPRPRVLIGVTPKSYGFFHLNDREREGRSMLEANEDPRAGRELLPGTNINTGWLLALEELAEHTGRAPNRRRYRRLQIIDVHRRHYVERTLERSVLDELRAQIGLPQRLFYGALARLAGLAVRVMPSLRRPIGGAIDRLTRQYPYYVPGRDPRHYASVSELLDQIDPDAYPERFA